MDPSPSPSPSLSTSQRTVRPAAGAWPRIWSGDRRRPLLTLVAAGVVQALAAAAAAVLVSRSLRAPDAHTRDTAFGLLLTVALLGGLLRVAERVVAERFGQSFVHEVRLLLLSASLSGQGASSLGVTVTRATNDLTALKNWLTLGIAPLVVGLPAVAGVLGALALIDPRLAGSVAVPLAAMALAALLLSPVGFARSRAVRRRRGRLSARVADTVLAGPAIRSGGGLDRELRRLAGASRELVDASVARAETAGALRGVGVATATATSAVVVWSGLHAGLSTATIAGALTVVGFLGGPLHDLARVVDQRQSYRAARRALGPGLPAPSSIPASGQVDAPGRERPPATSDSSPRPGRGTDGDSATVEIGPIHRDGVTVPATRLGPGSQLLVRGAAGDTAPLLALLGGVRTAHPGEVWVDGRDLALLSGRERRRLVGYASAGMTLVPGSIARTVGYRVPDDGAAVRAALESVGLGDVVAGLRAGLATRIDRDGAPLSRDHCARMLLARALAGTPPLLVIDRLEDELGPEGRALMAAVVGSYPGVVVLTSDEARTDRGRTLAGEQPTGAGAEHPGRDPRLVVVRCG